MRFTKMTALAVGMILMVFSLAVSSPIQTETQSSASANDKLANTEWTLKSFSSGGAETPVIAGTTITIKFDTKRRATGSGGCNTFGADYKVSSDKLSFSAIVATKRACVVEGGNEQEQRYFSALESASGFIVTGDNLTITYDGGKSTLNYVKGASASTGEPQKKTR